MWTDNTTITAFTETISSKVGTPYLDILFMVIALFLLFVLLFCVVRLIKKLGFSGTTKSKRKRH